jgi:uncharacterized protein YndB with AHSA1/START domain
MEGEIGVACQPDGHRALTHRSFGTRTGTRNHVLGRHHAPGGPGAVLAVACRHRLVSEFALDGGEQETKDGQAGISLVHLLPLVSC